MPLLNRTARLRKDLKLFDVYVISTGAMFSSGFFLLPGLAAAEAGPAVVLAYLVAGLLILPAMFSQAELSTAMPRAGGTYYFLDRSLGPLVGTVGGLGTFLALVLKSAFALVGMGAYLAFFVELPIKPLAIALTVVFVVVNILGAKETTGLQRWLVIVLLFVLTFFVVQGLFEVAGLATEGAVRSQMTPFMPFGVEGLLATVGLVFVSYAGLTKVASVAEEVQHPDRNIPLGMGLSLLTATAVYVVGVFIMVAVLEPETLRRDLTPVATAGEVFFDWLPKPTGLLLIVAAAVAAFASTGNAGLMSASRYPLAMARDRLIPDALAQLGRYHTPVRSVLLTGALMVVFILTLSETGIAKLASAFQLFIFILVNLAVIVMRESRIASYDPGYKSPWYPWTQVFGIVAPIFLIAFMGWLAIAFTVGLLGLGLAWYFYYARDRVVRDGAIYHWFERLGHRRYEGLDAELRTILKEKGLRAEDPFDEIVARAGVVDLKRSEPFEPVVRRVAGLLERHLGQPASHITKEFMEGTRVGATPVAHGIALPHILVEHLDRPHLVLVRSRTGIDVPVHEAEAEEDATLHEARTAKALFFLVSAADRPGQHLRILAQIAGRADDDFFLEDWNAARDEQELKEVLLQDEQFLALTIREKEPTALLAGRALLDVQWPEECLVVLIRRGEDVIVPRGGAILEIGDRLTIIGNREGIALLRARYAAGASGRRREQVAEIAGDGHAADDAGVSIVPAPNEIYHQKPAAHESSAEKGQEVEGNERFRRLLVGLGLREEDEPLLQYTGVLSRLVYPEHVRFVHVFRMPTALESRYIRQEYQSTLEGAARHLEAEVSDLVERHYAAPRLADVECEVVNGTSLTELLRMAKEDEADLLVAGRDRSGHTLTEKLARKAPCSVLVVPPDTPMKVERVLVAVDFSENAAEAVASAAALAEAASIKEVHVLHVYDVPRRDAGEETSYTDLHDAAREQGERDCRRFLEDIDLRGRDAALYFAPGDNVPGTICEHAEALQADLMVIGTRGRTDSSAVLMGSTAEEVVRWAHLPVLVVKEKGATLSLLEVLFGL